MATTITTQSTTIKRIVHDPARNRVLLISASGVDIYRVTDWTRIAWAALANVTCGAFNDGGIYLGTSTSGVFRMPLAATGAATSQLVSVFATGTAVALSSYDIKSIAGFGPALAIVTASEFVYLPNPATSYDGPVTATAVAMNGTYLAWATSSSVEILNTLPTADFSISDVSISDIANQIAFEVGTNNLLICHEDGLRLVDCADPGGAGGLPTDGLIAHYTMDAISGTSLLDETGSNNGTISGATQATGQIGKALSFDGINDKVDCGAFLTTAPSELTVAFWLKFDAAGSSDTTLFIHQYNHATGSRHWAVSAGTDGTLRFLVMSNPASYNAAQAAFSTGTYDDDEWHFVVARFKANTATELVIDGVADGSAASPSTCAAPTINMQMAYSPGSSYYQACSMDEVRVYNRILSDDEITSLYQQTDPTVPRAGLVAHYTMDAISGTTVYDEAGTQNAIISGATQTDGYIGKALTFGGDGDNVAIAKNSDFDFGSAQDFSYAVWFKTPETARGDILENGNQIGKWSTLYINNGIFAGALDDGTNAVWVSGSTNAWTVNDDAMHLGVVTFDRSGNAQRYIDGEAYGDPYDISSVGDITHATDGITLGTRHDHTDHFDGQMEGVRFYNRVLSAAEIAALFAETTNQPPRSGLDAHFTMDSINGTSLYDETGNNNGTINGAAQVAGYAGQALSFDGSNDFVEIAQALQNSVTFAAWFKSTATAAAPIFSNQNTAIGTTPTSEVPILVLMADGTIRAEWYSGSITEFVQTTATYNDGEWHHVAFVGDDGGTPTELLYIDSVLVASRGTADAINNTWTVYSAIGAAYVKTNRGFPSDGTVYFDGEIDGARVYSRALDAEEVGALFIEGLGGYGTNYDSDLGAVTDCQAAMKVGDYIAYGTSNDADGGRFGILELDTEGVATSKTTVASTDTDAVWLAAGATEAIYNNQLKRYRLVAEMSPAAAGRDVRRDWTLYAEITDALGGIQSGTVTLKVNGTSHAPTTAEITDGYVVSYTPGSSSGYGERVAIEISGTDADGNTVSRTWTFTAASAPALTVTDAAPPNVACIRDISLAAAESDETVDSVNVVWIDTITSPLIVTEAQAKEVGRVAIDGQTYHRHKVGVKVLATDSGDLQTRDLRQGGIATITCDALGMSAQKCEIIAGQRVISDSDEEDISFNLQAVYYEAVS